MPQLGAPVLSPDGTSVRARARRPDRARAGRRRLAGGADDDDGRQVGAGVVGGRGVDGVCQRRQYLGVPAAGGQPVRVTDGKPGSGDPRIAADRQPQWSPKGSWILFETGRRGNSDLARREPRWPDEQFRDSAAQPTKGARHGRRMAGASRTWSDRRSTSADGCSCVDINPQTRPRGRRAARAVCGEGRSRRRLVDRAAGVVARRDAARGGAAGIGLGSHLSAAGERRCAAAADRRRIRGRARRRSRRTGSRSRLLPIARTSRSSTSGSCR